MMNKTSAALPLLFTLALAACDVGEGNKPEAIRFVASTADPTDVAEVSAFECFTRSVTVIAEFTDGIPGDFSQRVRYRSDNEAVVRISNGDVVVPGRPGVAYVRGTLVPVSAGSATVTAEFGGLTDSVQVVVRRPESIIVSNEKFLDTDWTTERSVSQMVPGSFQLPVATVVLNDGTSTTTSNVASLGNWVTDAPAEVATIVAATGRINAVAPPPAPATHTATVSFAPCSGVDGAPPPPDLGADKLKLSTTFEVRAPERMLIVTEPGYPQDNGAMPNGSAQFVRVLADFDDNDANGTGQELTFKGVSFAFEPTGVLSYNTSTGLLFAGAVPAGQTENGPAQITASIGQDALKFSSEPLSMKVFAATLDSIEVSPAEATIEPLGEQLFTAAGKLTVNGVPGALTYPVNHDVVWSVSDNTVATISNFTINAGTAFSIKDEAGPEAGITVRASSVSLIPPTTSGAAVSDTAVLRIVESPAP
jgi:hypothetical protein